MKVMDEYDLVRHHYNRRSLWGTDTVLYRTRFFRNCVADELHAVSRGSMTYETDFGRIQVEERDFLVIPKGVTYRVLIDGEQDTYRAIYETRPELFLVPTEMVDHVYGKGRPAVDPERLQFPERIEEVGEGHFEVRVKYDGAFSEFLGEWSTIHYDFYPLEAAIIDGQRHVFKFNASDIERLGSTPVPFIGAAYLDNRANLAWTLHTTGGGGPAPVHRNPDVDELRYTASGPKMGAIQFTPQGVDHGAGRGYTRVERNRPTDAYDMGDILSAYTFKPVRGTAEAFRLARPCMC